MNENLLRGDLVFLTRDDPETLAKVESTWHANSEYDRLIDCEPARPVSLQAVQKWIEKQYDNPNDFSFTIRALQDGRIIGEIGFECLSWTHGDTFVGIGIGDPADWGKGYGTDAMKVILRYGFTELNLRRVTLDVFDYNPRGLRSYEKAGFVVEGRVRGMVLREGRRWDLVYMGILREDWMKLNEQKGEIWTKN